MSRWIDADALIESIKNTADLGGWIGAAVYHIKQVAIKYIDDAPSIDIEPKHGEWVDEADKYDASFGIHDYRCSNCNSYADEYIGGHEWYTADKPNFCPHCGADMRERKESE